MALQVERGRVNRGQERRNTNLIRIQKNKAIAMGSISIRKRATKISIEIQELNKIKAYRSKHIYNNLEAIIIINKKIKSLQIKLEKLLK